MLDGVEAGPYRLKSSFVAGRWAGVAASIAGALFCMGLYGSMELEQARGILHDTRLWAAEGPERPAKYDGHVTSHQFILNGYDLKLSWNDEQGEAHSKTLKFDTLFSTLDEHRHARVRLNPADPSDAALNLAADVSLGRWAAVVGMTLVGVGVFGLGLLWFARSLVLHLRRVRAAAGDGELMPCRLTAREPVVVNGRPTPRERFSIDALGAPVTCELKTKGNPPLVTPDGAWVLALVPRSRPTEAVVLGGDLAPLALGPEAREAARLAMQRFRPA
jgi:hypothetical protein